MEETVTKFSCARIQLKTAIRLYFEKNYIASITLAGAAQDILSHMAEKKTGVSTYTDFKNLVDSAALLSKSEKVSKRRIIHTLNAFYNEMKHNDSGEDYIIKENFEFEANDLICGAIMNYEQLIWGIAPSRLSHKFGLASGTNQ